MSIKCRIWWDSQLNSYVLSGAYNKALVEGIKAFVPTGSREYNDQSKFWFVTEQYGEFVRQLAEKAFGVGSVSFTSRLVTQQSQQQQRISPSSSGGQVAVQFLDLLPYEAAKRAYLIACQSMHPDKGGDPQKMARLNEVWDKVEKEVYKR